MHISSVIFVFTEAKKETDAKTAFSSVIYNTVSSICLAVLQGKFELPFISRQSDEDIETLTWPQCLKRLLIEKVIWFYDAPVIRFYYHAVSVRLLQQTMNYQIVHFRPSSFSFWVYSVSCCLLIMYHEILITQVDQALKIYRFPSRK